MIELSNVNLHYPVPGHFSHSLQTTISSKIGGVLGSSSAKDKEMKYVHALRDINLKLEDSSRLGIIGHNGAGKRLYLGYFLRFIHQRQERLLSKERFQH